MKQEYIKPFVMRPIEGHEYNPIALVIDLSMVGWSTFPQTCWCSYSKQCVSFVPLQLSTTTVLTRVRLLQCMYMTQTMTQTKVMMTVLFIYARGAPSR